MARRLHTVRPGGLVVVVCVFAALGWLGTLFAARLSWPTPSLPYTTVVTLAVVAALLVVLGLRVRAWRDGQRKRPLNPLFATRILLLAQSSSYAGAVLFGWHTGVLVDALNALGFGAPAAVVVRPLVLMGGAALMIAAGLVVERFCRIPPEDPDAVSGTPGAGGGEGLA